MKRHDAVMEIPPEEVTDIGDRVNDVHDSCRQIILINHKSSIRLRESVSSQKVFLDAAS